MHAATVRRLLASALLLAFVVMLGGGAVTAASAETTDDTATTPTAETAQPCVAPRPVDDDIIQILGRICDRRETPAVGVVGVSVAVEDDAGTVLGEAVSGSSGDFILALPGSVMDHLGKTYSLRIDEETLPEDTSPEVKTRTVRINTDRDQSVTFPVGEEDGGTGFAVRALQLAIGGLVFSVLLAMGALGLSMIFGTTGLTNFAHGELVTFGALVAFGIDRLPGQISIGGADITVIVGVIVAFALGGLFGWLNDRALWRPLRNRRTGLIAMMIVSIGLSLFLRNIFQYVSGAQSHNYSQYVAVRPWEVGPVLITSKQVIVFTIGMLVLVATTSVLRYTRLGKATRAVADSPALAASTGINVERVINIVWVAGAALAALAGALLGVTQGFDYQIGFKLLLLIFAAVVLGGLGTIWGAITGAFIIGIFVELTTLFVPAEFKFVGALLVLIVVLLIRPQGLLGRAERVG
jgi:branched-subunit amino acid ABC-type transport system permease component